MCATNIWARTTEQSVCMASGAGLPEETQGRKMKSDALAQRNGTYTWTTAKQAVKKPQTSVTTLGPQANAGDVQVKMQQSLLFKTARGAMCLVGPSTGTKASARPGNPCSLHLSSPGPSKKGQVWDSSSVYLKVSKP